MCGICKGVGRLVPYNRLKWSSISNSSPGGEGNDSDGKTRAGTWPNASNYQLFIYIILYMAISLLINEKTSDIFDGFNKLIK
jgi:hypothetical protein